mgnify:CR=1 FL=1
MTQGLQEDLRDLNELVDEAKSELVELESAPTVPPVDTSVVLPVGLWDPSNGVRDTAEVRELNGFDEEHIQKAKNLGASIQTILERAVVSVGGQPFRKEEADLLTIGDRYELLLGSSRVTWGSIVDVPAACMECESVIEVGIDMDDIERRTLDDKLTERSFEILLPSGAVATAGFPTGSLHRLVLTEEITTGAEMTTALIANCVTAISGHPFVNESTARSLPSRDRKAIADYFVDITPGPVLEGIAAECPDCGSEVQASIPVGALFPG